MGGSSKVTPQLKDEGKEARQLLGEFTSLGNTRHESRHLSFPHTELPFAVSLQSGVLYVYCSERWTVSTDLTDRGKVCFSVNVVFLLFYLRFSQDNILRLSRPIRRSDQTFLPVGAQSEFYCYQI